MKRCSARVAGLSKWPSTRLRWTYGHGRVTGSEGEDWKLECRSGAYKDGWSKRCGWVHQFLGMICTTTLGCSFVHKHIFIYMYVGCMTFICLCQVVFTNLARIIPVQSRCLFAHKAQFFLKQILKKAHPTFSITPDGVNVGFSYSLSMFASSEFLYIGPFIGMKTFYKQTKSWSEIWKPQSPCFLKAHCSHCSPYALWAGFSGFLGDVHSVPGIGKARHWRCET